MHRFSKPLRHFSQPMHDFLEPLRDFSYPLHEFFCINICLFQKLCLYLLSNLIDLLGLNKKYAILFIKMLRKIKIY